MKFYAIIDSGMEDSAEKELLELVNIKPKIYPGVLEFDLDIKELGFAPRNAVTLGSQIETDVYDLAKKQGEIPTESTEE